MSAEAVEENSDKEIETEELQDKVKVQGAPKVEEEQDLKVKEEKGNAGTGKSGAIHFL